MLGKRRIASAVVAGFVMLVMVAGGVAGAQEVGDEEGAAPTSSTCVQSQGGGTGKNTFQTCISDHGNVTFFNHNAPTADPLGHLFGQEGYFVFFNEEFGALACMWDAGDGESANWVNISAAPSGANYRVVRRHPSAVWELEQIFGTTVVKKTQKIIMIYKNLSGITHTGVKVGRYANIDAEGTNDDDVFLNSNIDSSILGVDGDSTGIGGTGSGITIMPRSYGALPVTETESFANWSSSRDDCIVGTPAGSPTAEGDWVAWAYYPLGTVTAGNTKLVVYEYRAM